MASMELDAIMRFDPKAKGGVAKRPKYSRNKKKNWIKYIDMKPMEAFIEDESLAHRTGGHVEDRPDHELFVIDTQPVATAPPTQPRRQRARKPLRIAQALDPSPKVKPVGQYDQKRKRGGPRAAKGPETDVENRSASLVPSALGGEMKKKSSVYDLWDNVEEASQQPITQQAKSFKPAASLSTALSAVEIACPGQSYNPSFVDHQAALRKAASHIIKEEKTSAHWQAKAKGVGKAVSQAQYNREMALSIAANGEVEITAAHSDTDEETATIEPAFPMKRSGKKTRAQRNKEARIKAEERRRLAERQRKVKESQVYQIKAINRDIERSRLAAESRAKRKERRKLMAMYRPAKMSRYGFVEQPIDVKLTDELTPSLRELQPEGNLFADRFRQLQRRNMIEVRQRSRLRRRHGFKVYEKRSFKADPNRVELL